MVDKETLEKVNGSLNGSIKLDFVDPKELKLLEKNARFMPAEQFHNLVGNIKRDDGLSSVPFCCIEDDGRYLVLSGNHRVMAAVEAGIEEILIMYTEKKLTKSEKLAIQLSHNSIVGEDDKAILKELWDEINDVDMKEYSGLDDKLLEELEKIQMPAIKDVGLEYSNMSFLFFPEEFDYASGQVEEAIKMSAGDKTYIARDKEFDRLIKHLHTIKLSHCIENAATGLMVILDVFERHQEDLVEGWQDRAFSKGELLPAAAIFGDDFIPAEDADVVQKALRLMVDRGELKNDEKHKAIGIWAKEYLDGD